MDLDRVRELWNGYMDEASGFDQSMMELAVVWEVLRACLYPLLDGKPLSGEQRTRDQLAHALEMVERLRGVVPEEERVRAGRTGYLLARHLNHLEVLLQRLLREIDATTLVMAGAGQDAGDLVLSERALRFLEESNAIENITNIDYRRPENARRGEGHAGAFLATRAAGGYEEGPDWMRIHRLAGAEREAALAEVFRPKHRALTLADLCNWQAMITREQLRFGHLIPEQAVGRVRGPELPFDVCVGDHVAPGFAQVPALMEEWLGDLNRRVSSLERKFDNDVPADADLIGEFFQRFEAIHPFVDGNGRTGRLVVNYLTSALGRPEVVISFADRSQFYRAHRSKVAMKAFMLDRLCDAMWSTNGQLGIWVATEAGWLRYRLPDGTLFSFEEDQIDQVRTAWRAEAGEPDAESIRRSPRRGLAWRWLARWWRSR